MKTSSRANHALYALFVLCMIFVFSACGPLKSVITDLPDTMADAGEPDADDEEYDLSEFGHRCPEVGDHLYFLVDHNYIQKHGTFDLNAIAFAEQPYELNVVEFDNTKLEDKEIAADVSIVADPGAGLFTIKYGTVIEDKFFSGWTSLVENVSGFCWDGDIYLTIEESWSETIIQSEEGGQMSVPGGTPPPQFMLFSYYDAEKDGSIIDKRPYGMAEGWHGWRLYTDYSTAYAEGLKIKSWQEEDIGSPVPLVPEEEE